MSDELRGAIDLVGKMIKRNEEWRNSFDPAKGPMSEDRAALELEKSARNAILLMPRSLPVLAGSAARSFFGGLPQLPRLWRSPAKVVDGRYRYLAFIAPRSIWRTFRRGERSPLPASGKLYFFVDLSREWLENDAAVLWHERPRGAPLESANRPRRCKTARDIPGSGSSPAS